MLLRCMFLWLCLQAVCADDASVLLQFRDALHDPSGELLNWGVSSNGSQSSPFCKWYGVTCNERNRVETLDISLNRKGGASGAPLENSVAVLAILGNLQDLRFLTVYRSFLSGSFTSDVISSLRSLQQLFLIDNSLNGSIPESFGSLANLTSLSLSQNNLTGYIPQSLGLLSSLRYIDLSHNYFIGSIPASLANTSLETLDLSSNSLSGLIPSTLGSLSPTLRYFILADNLLEGFSIPTLPFGNLTSLLGLNLSGNRIAGTIPVALGSLFSLRALYLDRNMLEGPIPPELGYINKCRVLLLSNNRLSGSIPSNLAGMANIVSLTYLDLSDNMLEGLIPPSLLLWNSFFTGINLSRNRLTGIPREICVPLLQVLDLSFNQIVGPIPAVAPQDMCRPDSLQYISLNDNELDGDISSLVANGSSLQLVNLRNNKFGGNFPLSLLKLPRLRVMTLAHNQFYGAIPPQITNLSDLQILDLSANNFSGSIPGNVSGLLGFQQEESSSENYYENTTLSGFGEFYQLEVTIQLKGSAVVLTQVLKARTMMDLSSNSLTGNIPEELGSLIGLKYLNFSRNQIYGLIPGTLANVSSLESIDLSYNNLTGEIPAKFASLHRLSEMDVAHNNLSGYVPTGSQFDGFPDSSFEGNPLLFFQCGATLPHKCTPQPSPKAYPTPVPFGDQPGGSIEKYMSVLAVGSGFALGFVTVFAFFIFSTIGWSYMTNARESKPLPVRYGFFSPPL